MTKINHNDQSLFVRDSVKSASFSTTLSEARKLNIVNVLTSHMLTYLNVLTLFLRLNSLRCEKTTHSSMDCYEKGVNQKSNVMKNLHTVQKSKVSKTLTDYESCVGVPMILPLKCQTSGVWHMFIRELLFTHYCPQPLVCFFLG